MTEIESEGAGEGADHETRQVSPLEVELDPYNPRLTLEEEGSSQAALLEIMIKRFKIEELAESILASGFNPFDPIVGWSHNDRLTVLEGNRRVAAMQLLLEPQRAPAAYERRWTALSERLTPEVRATIEQIDVTVYRDRDAADVAAYIGFRHVTGVLKWPSLEKAKYIARLVEDHGWTYERIAERLGSYPRHVERHYVAYRLVRQVSEEEIPGAESMEGAFGVLLRALQAEGIAEFIGVEYPGDPERSRQPVPADRVENLRDFVVWTFGTEDRARVLPDSRRLTDLGQILQAPEALAYLRRTADPSFERAFFRSGGQARSLAESLFTASDRLEETVPLVSEHVDNAEVQEGVRQTTRFLTQILRHFPDIANDYGFRRDER